MLRGEGDNNLLQTSGRQLLVGQSALLVLLNLGPVGRRMRGETVAGGVADSSTGITDHNASKEGEN